MKESEKGILREKEKGKPYDGKKAEAWRNVWVWKATCAGESSPSCHRSRKVQRAGADITWKEPWGVGALSVC